MGCWSEQRLSNFCLMMSSSAVYPHHVPVLMTLVQGCRKVTEKVGLKVGGFLFCFVKFWFGIVRIWTRYTQNAFRDWVLWPRFKADNWEVCVCVDWQKTSLSLSARTTTPQILGVALLLVSRLGQRSGQGQPHANVPGLSSLSLTLFVLSTGTKPQGQWKKTTTTDFF